MLDLIWICVDIIRIWKCGQNGAGHSVHYTIGCTAPESVRRHVPTRRIWHAAETSIARLSAIQIENCHERHVERKNIHSTQMDWSRAQKKKTKYYARICSDLWKLCHVHMSSSTFCFCLQFYLQWIRTSDDTAAYGCTCGLASVFEQPISIISFHSFIQFFLLVLGKMVEILLISACVLAEDA